MTEKGYWIAFIVGVSAGATVALLYAPDTGLRTRKRLGKGIDQSVDYLEDAAEYLKKQADLLSHQAKSTIDRTKHQVQDAVEMVADKATDTAKSLHSLV